MASNKENLQRWRAANPERAQRVHRDGHLRRTYGISIEEYDRTRDAQNGRCLICHKSEEEITHKRLAVDHCHETGKVRGLLCKSCNVSMGHFKDDPLLIQAAINYLVASRVG